MEGKSDSMDQSSGLTIGIDASFLARDQRGMGRFVRSVLECWKQKTPHRFILLCQHARHMPGLEAYKSDGWDIRQASDLPALDVCWFPWSRVDWDPRCPVSAFIHDVAPFTEFHPLKHAAEDRQRLLDAAEMADQVQTNSNYSRVEIARHLDWSLSDIEVVHLAYDASIFHPLQNQQNSPTLTQGLEAGNFLLFVGNLEPRKNLLLLLEALELCYKDVTLPLALVSPKPEVRWFEKLQGRSNPIRSACTRLVDRLVWLETSSDLELAKLYRHARLFIMPSLHEGFGLPLLEALGCGCLTAAAKAASLPEVGGNAPYWFDPKDPVDIARVLTEAMKVPEADRQIQRQACVDQASHFTWEKTASTILQLIEELARHGRDNLSGEILLAQEGDEGVLRAGTFPND